jgi:hypothetical protein
MIIAFGGGIKAFYFGFYLSESKHPIKPYKIAIYKIPSFLDWQTGTPGDSGNSRIRVRLYDADGNNLQEVRTTLNDLSAKMWTDDAAIITSDIVWLLPDKIKSHWFVTLNLYKPSILHFKAKILSHFCPPSFLLLQDSSTAIQR